MLLYWMPFALAQTFYRFKIWPPPTNLHIGKSKFGCTFSFVRWTSTEKCNVKSVKQIQFCVLKLQKVHNHSFNPIMLIQITILEDFRSQFDITCYRWTERIFYLQIQQVFSSASTLYWVSVCTFKIHIFWITKQYSVILQFPSVQISKPRSVDDNKEIQEYNSKCFKFS
jgi:hypothetical protein